MENKIKELKTRLGEINDLQMAAFVLMWDQYTMMPPGGAQGRGRQVATLQRLAQEKSSDPVLGKLIDTLEPYTSRLDYDSDIASLVRVARRDFERANKIPPEFTARLYTHSSESYIAWTEARPENNFAKVRPLLEKTLDLSREYANYFPGYAHIADPLIDITDPGMSASNIQAMFANLRTELVPLARRILERQETNDACLHQHFSHKDQIEFSEKIIRQLGYDLQRGRQDLSPHPFTIRFAVGDVRITTRVREDYLGETLFSSIHEAGHAMYEQGVDADLDGTPLARGASAGVHESQSRLWENIVGRSLPFWEHFYPKLQTQFPGQLADVSLETFYRAVNKVERGPIRTDADEVTYNLHVMIRFDLELAMLEGTLEVKDLPQSWNARYMNDLGITPPNDRDGCLQDAHWYDSTIGGQFQGYTLGNILGALFYHQALAAHPEIPLQMRHGEFNTLLGWLRQNIYRHGRKFTMLELVQRICGDQPHIGPYVDYLTKKYEEVYGL